MPINIHGKDYITVAERVKEFRKNYPTYKMVDEVINYTNDTILIKTSILNDNNEVVATGLAREVREDSKINETSYVENAETSAWGRALANLGIGIDTEIASANEVENAIRQQNTPKQINTQPVKENAPQPKIEPNKAKSKYQILMEWCNENGIDKLEAIKTATEMFNGQKINDISDIKFDELKRKLKPEIEQEFLKYSPEIY